MENFPGLRPHEVRLVKKWQAKEREASQMGQALGSVYEQAKALKEAQANWSPLPPLKEINCQTCKDSGFLMPRPTKLNWQQRRARLCPDCGNSQQEKRVRLAIRQRWPVNQALIEEAALPIESDYIDLLPTTKEFTQQKKEAAKQILRHAYKLARDFASAWPKGVMLSFDGPPGAAKTHLAGKIYRFAILKGLAAIFLTGEELETISKQFLDQEREKKRFDLIHADLLVLDEADHISKKDGTGWAERYLFNIIDARLKAGRSTILTGNALNERLPEAVKSRAKSASSRFIDMSGVPDGRPIFAGDDSWVSTD